MNPFLQPLLPLILVFVVMAAYSTCALFFFRREKSARRLEPPEKLLLLRGPGESLRLRMEVLWEQWLNHLFFGGCCALGLGLAPVLLLKLFPGANALILLASGGVLFAAVSIWVVREMRRFLHERANARLGFFGEQWVAEQLQGIRGTDYRVFHDVPKGEPGKSGNIDHVVLGPLGAAVVETKTRGKPTDRKNGSVVVEYDGRRISWPRFSNDTDTLKQVRKNAEWLRAFILRECDIPVPVAQVVAIPGWRVTEKVLSQPRVVSGKGVADAVMQGIHAHANGTPLSGAQLGRISLALEARCRDVAP